MKTVFISALTLLIFLWACEKSTVQSVEPKVDLPSVSQKTPTETENLADSPISPTAIQNCLPKVNVGESIDFDLSVNPFYLRLDFDGNRKIDYAVRIKGKETKAKGLLICKDGEEPFIFGKLAKSKTPLTDVEDDNFMMDDWDVVTKADFRNSPTYPQGGKGKEGANAKGEAVAFTFPIDGVMYIYWDGKNFRSFSE
jgi:hypothetical protein